MYKLKCYDLGELIDTSEVKTVGRVRDFFSRNGWACMAVEIETIADMERLTIAEYKFPRRNKIIQVERL